MTPIRVLLVDDSAALRRLVAEALAADPAFAPPAQASNGLLALSAVKRDPPDVVVLDLDMPVMNGYEFLQALRPLHPRLPVIVFSSFSTMGAEATLQALWHGASDYLPKPAHANPQGAAAHVRSELAPRLKALAEARAAATAHAASAPASAARPGAPARRARAAIVGIAASTGGPRALAALLAKLPADFAAPILVVQHMPRTFTRHLADGLAAQCDLRVDEAEDGAPLEAGRVWVAPGERHLVLARRGDAWRLALDDSPPVNACRPSADPLFRSLAHAFGGGALAVVMTGMGRDGLDGARAVREAGGRVLVQDEATSVVWGMPGNVARAGLADAALAPESLAAEIAERASAGGSRRAA